jgi:hypothetical protein
VVRVVSQILGSGKTGKRGVAEGMTRTVVELDTLHAASAPRSAWISASFRSHQGVVDIFRHSCARTKVAPMFRNKSGR